MSPFSRFIVAALLLPFALAAPKSLSKRDLDTSKHCGDQDRTDVGQYTLSTDTHGKSQDGEGRSCYQVHSLDGTKVAWENDWQWARADGSVKAFTYLNLNQGLNKQLSAIQSIQATWHYTYQDGDSGQRGFKKDTFVTIPWRLTTSSSSGGAVANEIRIFLGNVHVPLVGTSVASTVKIGSDNSNWSDYDYTLRTEFDGDLNWFIKYLTSNQGLSADQYLTAIQGGSEAVGGTVTVNTERFMKRLILKKSKANARRGKVAKNEGAEPTAETHRLVYDLSEQSKEIGGLKRGTASQFMGARLEDNPDGWTECYISGRAKRKILETPGFPESLPRPTQPDCFRVVDIPGKGRGIVATKDIKWGNLIFAERALIITPVGLPSGSDTEIPKHFTNAQREQVFMMDIEHGLDILVKRMPEENQKAFMELWNCHTEDGSGPLLGICRTNGLALQDYYEPSPVSQKKLVVIAERSRSFLDLIIGEFCFPFLSPLRAEQYLTNSCGPNIDHNWDSPTFSMHLRATRDIKEGEELCISYIPDLLEPAASRQRGLRAYGFVCACERCSTAAVSDARSKKIKEITEPGFMAMLVHGSDVMLKQSIDRVRRGIQLMEEEGLQSQYEYGQLLSKMSQACGSFLDDEEGEQRYKKMYMNHRLATKSGRNEEMQMDEMASAMLEQMVKLNMEA
uniref:SET domain-containing protein n=1 Tax=Moniliophthora roreri TaxID=221103 RepID=A0A0W0FVI9_MONRR